MDCFWQLLNPFALLSGVVSTAMITLHGTVYLVHRTEGDIQRLARRAAFIFGALLLLCFSITGLWLASGIDGYVITSAVNASGQSSPLDKTVVREAGAWLTNYRKAPATMALPLLAYVGVLAAGLLVAGRRTALAFVASAVAIAGVVGTAGASMFPFVMPSSTMPNASLTVWDSVSSHLTLSIMFWVTLIFMPLIIFYTSWAYKVMSGKVTEAYIRENDHGAY